MPGRAKPVSRRLLLCLEALLQWTLAGSGLHLLQPFANDKAAVTRNQPSFLVFSLVLRPRSFKARQALRAMQWLKRHRPRKLSQLQLLAPPTQPGAHRAKLSTHIASTTAGSKLIPRQQCALDASVRNIKCDFQSPLRACSSAT